MLRLWRLLVAARSEAASRPAPETRSTKTGNGWYRTPRADSLRPKSTTLDLRDRVPPLAESVPPIPAVQPFPLARNCCRFIRGTITHPAFRVAREPQPAILCDLRAAYKSITHLYLRTS